MQTKPAAGREPAARHEQDATPAKAMRDLDFSTILDTELLQNQCDAVAEANRNRPDVMRSDLLAVLKKASTEGRQKARAALAADGSGLNCAYRISWLQDQIITVLYNFATAHIFPQQKDKFAEMHKGGDKGPAPKGYK